MDGQPVKEISLLRTTVESQIVSYRCVAFDVLAVAQLPFA